MINLNSVFLKNYFSLFESQANISFIDLLDKNLFPNKISFSGTVNFNLPSQILEELKPGELDYYNTGIASQLNDTDLPAVLLNPS